VPCLEQGFEQACRKEHQRLLHCVAGDHWPRLSNACLMMELNEVERRMIYYGED
jgi:hypothetical protein